MKWDNNLFSIQRLKMRKENFLNSTKKLKMKWDLISIQVRNRRDNYLITIEWLK